MLQSEFVPVTKTELLKEFPFSPMTAPLELDPFTTVPAFEITKELPEPSTPIVISPVLVHSELLPVSKTELLDGPTGVRIAS